MFNLYWLISFKVLESVWHFFQELGILSRIGYFGKNWAFLSKNLIFFGNNWIIFRNNWLFLAAIGYFLASFV